MSCIFDPTNNTKDMKAEIDPVELAMIEFFKRNPKIVAYLKTLNK